MAGGTTIGPTARASLAEIFDAGAAVEAVEAVLPLAGLPTGATVRSVTTLDGKPGERLLLRFDVVAGRARGTVFGKVYADLTTAARLHETMSHLWEAFAGCDRPTTVPRPVALLPELGMVVYLPAPGTPLDTTLDGPGAPAALELAGAWLAHLHGVPVPLGRRFDLDTELRNATSWGTLVAVAAPDLAGVVTDLCLRLRAWSDGLALEDDTPIHKDFHPGHVIVDGGVAVVDFDESRLGDPAFDVAHFCAYLHLLALRSGLGTRLGALEAAFVDSYVTRTGWVADGRFAFFRAYTAVKIAKQLATARGLRPRPCGADLGRQLRQVLVEGARWVEVSP